LHIFHLKKKSSAEAVLAEKPRWTSSPIFEYNHHYLSSLYILLYSFGARLDILTKRGFAFNVLKLFAQFLSLMYYFVYQIGCLSKLLFGRNFSHYDWKRIQVCESLGNSTSLDSDVSCNPPLPTYRRRFYKL